MKLSDGTIVHERNLDFDFPDVMRNVTYIGKYLDGDAYLFDAVMFAGYNNVLTAEKKGAFSVSLNLRKPSYREDPFGLIENIGMVVMGFS